MKTVHEVASRSLAALDLNLLVVLDALLREGSATRAARRIARTQSAVSHALARLRDVFDDPLFVRVGSTLKPTPRAEALRAPLADVLERTQSLLLPARFDPSRLERTFHLGSTDLLDSAMLPALLVTPICLILLLNAFQPAYMNSRHLSLLGGVYVLLLGAGLSVLWQLQKVATILVALVLLAGAGYSTHNYFTSELYDKDDYVGMCAFVAEHLLPGDLLLISPPFSWRIFDYYLPIEQLHKELSLEPRLATHSKRPIRLHYDRVRRTLDEPPLLRQQSAKGCL